MFHLFLPHVWINPVVWGSLEGQSQDPPLVNGVWIHQEKLIHTSLSLLYLHLALSSLVLMCSFAENYECLLPRCSQIKHVNQQNLSSSEDRGIGLSGGTPFGRTTRLEWLSSSDACLTLSIKEHPRPSSPRGSAMRWGDHKEMTWWIVHQMALWNGFFQNINYIPKNRWTSVYFSVGSTGKINVIETRQRQTQWQPSALDINKEGHQVIPNVSPVIWSNVLALSPAPWSLARLTSGKFQPTVIATCVNADKKWRPKVR